MPRKKKRRKRRRGQPATPKPRTTQAYQDYIASPAWRMKRHAAFMAHGRYCRVCRTTIHLEVHHKHYARLFNERVGDLEILCRTCHRHEHGAPIPQDELYDQWRDAMKRAM